MSDKPLFLEAFPYQDSLLTLPVRDLDGTSDWYGRHFGMTEAERPDGAPATVILERDGVRLGFAITGADPEQDGAAILVSDIDKARAELQAAGLNIKQPQEDERDGQRFRAFFVIAPDGLCYYFHQHMGAASVQP